MSLDEYAAIAEGVGGIAVIVSLLYVAFQIRLNTAERRADSIQSITAAHRELALVYVNNHKAGTAWHKVLRGEELSQSEVELMADSLFAHLMALEETYNKYLQGYVEKEFLDARLALIESKILWSPQMRAIHEQMVSAKIYTKTFADWLQEALKQSEWYETGRPTIAEVLDEPR